MAGARARGGQAVRSNAPHRRRPGALRSSSPFFPFLRCFVLRVLCCSSPFLPHSALVLLFPRCFSPSELTTPSAQTAHKLSAHQSAHKVTTLFPRKTTDGAGDWGRRSAVRAAARGLRGGEEGGDGCAGASGGQRGEPKRDRDERKH
eukprot:108605-Rhodomonas_salina.1